MKSKITIIAILLMIAGCNNEQLPENVNFEFPLISEHNNSPLKIYYMSHAAMAANSTSSLTSLSFNLLFGFMPDTQINRSSR